MTTRTIGRPKAKKVTVPAKRWRNKFRLQRRGRDTAGNRYSSGLVWGNLVYPSKDVAETDAAKRVLDPYWAARGIKHVGAFPVEAS